MDNNSHILNTLFKSKARAKLLTNFYINPHKKYFVRELERLFVIPVGNVAKELKKLETAGLITSEKVGNMLFYNANTNSSIYEELRAIVLKTTGVETFFKPFANDKSITAAFIYGSYASGKLDAHSDIDFFVITHDTNGKNIYQKLNDKLEVTEKILGREINMDMYSCKEFLEKVAKDDPYISDILKSEKVIVRGGECGEYKF